VLYESLWWLPGNTNNGVKWYLEGLDQHAVFVIGTVGDHNAVSSPVVLFFSVVLCCLLAKKNTPEKFPGLFKKFKIEERS